MNSKRFKRGDIIHISFGLGPVQQLVLVDQWEGQDKNLLYLFRCTVDGVPILSIGPIGYAAPRTDREATLQERTILLESLRKSGEAAQFYSLFLEQILEEI